MDHLIEKYYRKLDATPMDRRRFLLSTIDWKDRFIGINGARGTGKTTLLFQYLHLNAIPADEALYVSLDDLYFTENRLVDLVDRFVQRGGKYLLLDEVHRYANWSSELKTIYDDHAGLQVIFTGSSLIHIEQAKGDLSRRAVVYELPGLSFREFLQFEGVFKREPVSLEDILSDHTAIARSIVRDIRPLAYFGDYLKYGYYPYYLENRNTYHQKLAETINIALSTDLPASYDLSYGTIEKVRLLLHVLAESAPVKPNVSKLSERVGATRNSLLEFLRYLEEMRIVKRLYSANVGMSRLQKPDKLFLFHPNLHYALSYSEANIGTMRESFFLNQLAAVQVVRYTAQGDFMSGKTTFEIGGRSKTQRQIKGLKDAFIVADDLEIGTANRIPLWLFGFLY